MKKILQLEGVINDKIKWNIIFAIVCIPLFSLGGEIFKYAILPYIAYMVFSRNPDYLPSLIIFMIPGNVITVTILLLSFIVTLYKIKIFKNSNIKFYLYLTLLPTPYLIINSIYRIIYVNKSIIEELVYLSMFFGLFAFFYFYILTKEGRLKLNHIIVILALLFFVILLNFLYPEDDPIRYIFFSFPLAGSFIFSVRNTYFSKFDSSIKLFSLIAFLYFLYAINYQTFTLLLSAIISIHLIYLYNTKKIKSLKLYTSYLPFVLSVIFVFYAIKNSEIYSVDANQKQVVEYSTLSLEDMSAFKNRLLNKAFDDRAPLWNGIYLSILNNPRILPPTSIEEYTIVTNEGFESQSELPAHNLFLELIRLYGLLFGIIASIVFIHFIVSASKLLLTKNLNPIVCALLCVYLAVGIAGSTTGQFPLLFTFSFMFLGLGGYFEALKENIYVSK